MALSPTSSLQILAPSSMFHDIKAQWNVLQHSLSTISPAEPYSNMSTCYSSVDRSVLITALVKKKAELELLRNEMQTTAAGSIHNLPVESLNDSSSTTVQGKFREFSESMKKTKHARHTSAIDTHPIVRIPSKHCDTTTSWSPNFEFSPLSPLSPTFGPRMGHIPSGTVVRRRSLPNNGVDNTHSAFVDNNVQRHSVARKLDWERRVQWEAAWAWIEQHLGTYAEGFAASPNTYGTSQEIWEELVRLKKEAAALGERLKGMNSDIQRQATTRSSI